MGFPKFRGTLGGGGPYIKGYGFLVFILGSPCLGKLPYELKSKLCKVGGYGYYKVLQGHTRSLDYGSLGELQSSHARLIALRSLHSGTPNSRTNLRAGK